MPHHPLPIAMFHWLWELFYSPMFHLVLLAIFAAAVIIIVRTAPKNICLGVRIPPDKYDAMPCRLLRGRFDLGVVILAALAGGMIWLSQTQMSKASMDAVVYSSVQILFFMGVLLWFYYVIRRAMFKLVEREGWVPDREPGKVVIDTSFHQRKKSLSPLWLLPFPIIIIATLCAYQHWRPELYSGRFQPVFSDLGFRNIKPTVLGNQTAGSVIAFLKNAAFYLQIMFTAWTAFVFFAFANARQSLNPNDPTGSLEEELRRRKKLQAMQVIAYTMCAIMVAILPFVVCRNAVVPIFAYCAFPIYAAACLFLLHLYSRTGKTATAKSDKKKRENWLFYRNADDPALFLWSRTGVGFLMNIARPTVKILCGGFGLLAVGLLWYVVCNAPMTSPSGFFFLVDKATQERDTHGANLFLDAAYHSGDMMTPQTLNSYRHPFSVKGKIERIEVTSHFPDEFEIWQRSNDFYNKLRDYLDEKITLDDFGEHYTIETVCEDKVVFGEIRSITVDAKLQKRRELGQFDDKQYPALTVDEEYLYHSESPFEWRESYKDFQFETMGQLQGRAAGSLVGEMSPCVNTVDIFGENVFDRFRETFLRDAAIVDYYHGKKLFDVVGTEMYDGNNQASVLEGRDYDSSSRIGWFVKYRVLIDPSRNYASPYGWFYYSRGIEAWRASDYFKFGPHRWVPQNYKAFQFSYNHDSVKKSVEIVRVTIDPNTVKEGRQYQETWDEETQTRAYVEIEE